MIHVYGVVDQLRELPPLSGLDDAPLERRRVDGLELVVSDWVGGEITQEAVLRHAEVVEGLMDRSDALLPAQFGPPFGGDNELAASIRTRARDLARGLERVRGCVEFGLRVAGERESVASGTEYMRARLAQQRVVEPLERLARASTATAYLVPTENVDAFREGVRRVQDEHPELTIVCTGPWPPYSFGAEGA